MPFSIMVAYANKIFCFYFWCICISKVCCSWEAFLRVHGHPYCDAMPYRSMPVDHNFNDLFFLPTLCNKIAWIFLGYILTIQPELTCICTVSSIVLCACISTDKILHLKYIFVSKLPTQDAVLISITVNGVGWRCTSFGYWLFKCALYTSWRRREV